MGWTIDPYTGRPRFVPEGGPEMLGNLIGGPRRQAEEDARRRALADILERYGQTERGTPWLAPEVPGMPRMPTDIQTQAEISRRSTPGSPEYDALIAQLADIRARGQFEDVGLSPETYKAQVEVAGEERLGTESELEYGQGGFMERRVSASERQAAAAEQRARSSAARQQIPKKITRTVTTPEGLPATQDTIYNPDGTVETGPIVPKGGGQALVFNPQTGQLEYAGPAEKAGMVTEAVGQAKGKQALRAQRPAVLNLNRQLDRVEESLAQGATTGAIVGQLGNIATTAASLARQAGQVGQVLGTNTVDEFVTKGLSDPAIGATLRTAGDLRNQELALAYARVMSYGVKDPGQREIQRAIEANAPIFGGDPVSRSAAIASLRRDIVESYNLNVKSAGLDELTIEAPGLPSREPAELPEGWKTTPSGLRYRLVD